MSEVRTRPVALQLQSLGLAAPRLIVFEYDLECDGCASVLDIVEGPREFIEEFIQDNYPYAPVFLRVGLPNAGEIRLFGNVCEKDVAETLDIPFHESFPIIWRAGETASETYDLLLKAESNPPPAFEDIMPEMSAQYVSDRLLAGGFNITPGTFIEHQVGDETIIARRIGAATFIEIYSKVGSWKFDIESGCFIRKN